MSKRIYADNSATTPVLPAVFEAMKPYFCEVFGNPSAVYSYGREASKALEDSRRSAAKCLGALSSEIFFTSGGTESNNWAIASAALQYGSRGRHIISSAAEHKAVLKPLERLAAQGFDITLLTPDRTGRVSPSQLSKAVRPDTILVSLMMAANVTGTISDIQALAAAAHEKSVLFHTDAVQAAAYLPINVRRLDVDLLSLSGHKFHGPKGSGLLFAKIPRLPAPFICGGGQEKGGRSGTENVPGIVGLAKALAETVKTFDQTSRLMAMRDQLIDGILKIPGSFLTGAEKDRLPGHASFVFSGLKNSIHLVNRLNDHGICASSGAACSVSSQEGSYVLKAMGYSEDLTASALRLSLTVYNTPEEVKIIADLMPALVREVRNRPE
ncbi:MAG: cysteine desulfurase [Deltaproteobacteria bacterium]|jgi:cysteine desulfurase|nr:cysteine desulfurase [Deltaproteobacteria bacterium]